MKYIEHEICPSYNSVYYSLRIDKVRGTKIRVLVLARSHAWTFRGKFLGNLIFYK